MRLGWLALVCGCALQKGDSAAEQFEPAPWSDADQDGYIDAPEDDCDDDNFAVNPAAAELCNGVDDNCDDQVDVDVAPGTDGATTRYQDTDGDGYGDAATAGKVVCDDGGDLPGVDNNADCDDGDADIHPDALEICDGVDQDCDGEADDDPTDGATYYADTDGDGAGDPDQSERRCADGAGWVSTADDCDDADPDVGPDSTVDEVCGDGVDQNCTPDCAQPEESEAGDAALGALLVSTTAQDHLGNDLLVADLTWDGVADLVVAAAQADRLDGRTADHGVVYILEGPVTEDKAARTDSWAMLVGALDYNLPTSMARIPDVDGDGHDGLAAGLADGYGKVFLYTTFAASADPTDLSDVVYIYGGPSTNLGVSLDGAGSLDADASPDLLAGAYTTDSYAGAAFVLLEPAAITSSPTLDALQTDGAAYALSGDDQDLAGSAVAVLDFNADGAQDALVGAPTVEHAGYAALADGPLDGERTLRDLQLITGEADDCRAGAAVAGGDLNADGYDDAVVGAPGCTSAYADDGGAVYVIFGGEDLSTRATADLTLYAEVDHDRSAFGTSVATAFDEDADGYDDLLVGAPSYTRVTGTEGAAALYYGGASWAGTATFDDADTRYWGDATGDTLGTAVAAGDVGGDGRDDLIMSAPAAKGSTGLVYVIPGLGGE